MAAVLPFWTTLRSNQTLRAALLGVNASVVGILAAALVHPLWTSTVHTPADILVAAVAFIGLQFGRVQPWMVVAAVVLLALIPGVAL
jgi:chromate transporter